MAGVPCRDRLRSSATCNRLELMKYAFQASGKDDSRAPSKGVFLASPDVTGTGHELYSKWKNYISTLAWEYFMFCQIRVCGYSQAKQCFGSLLGLSFAVLTLN